MIWYYVTCFTGILHTAPKDNESHPFLLHCELRPIPQSYNRSDSFYNTMDNRKQTCQVGGVPFEAEPHDLVVHRMGSILDTERVNVH